MHTGTIQSRTKSKLLTCRFPALPSASWRPGGHPRASRRNGGSRGAGESCWGRGVLTGESEPLSHRATDTRTGRAQRSKLDLSVDGGPVSCPCVSHLLGDKTFCTGIRRCARPVRALRPPPVRCTPYASQIPRRRCSTSTGRSVSPQRLPPSPPPADLCPPPMDLVRVVGSESGRYHPPLTPERLF